MTASSIVVSSTAAAMASESDGLSEGSEGLITGELLTGEGEGLAEVKDEVPRSSMAASVSAGSSFMVDGIEGSAAASVEVKSVTGES